MMVSLRGPIAKRFSIALLLLIFRYMLRLFSFCFIQLLHFLCFSSARNFLLICKKKISSYMYIFNWIITGVSGMAVQCQSRNQVVHQAGKGDSGTYKIPFARLPCTETGKTMSGASWRGHEAFGMDDADDVCDHWDADLCACIRCCYSRRW